jgi:hypothetical protein
MQQPTAQFQKSITANGAIAKESLSFESKPSVFKVPSSGRILFGHF